MKPSLRVLSLLVAALFLTLPASAVCILSQSNAPSRADLVSVAPGGAVGQDLNEWAILFNDIRNHDACDPNDEVIEIFVDKLKAQKAANGFTGFLSGGITSLAYSTAMVIGNMDKLDDYPEIDQLLGDMRWASELRGGCGFANDRWRAGNTCFEELAVTAQGHAWRGAYFKYSNREARADDDRREAVRRINETLLNLDDSVCIYDPSRSVDGPKGPCNATLDELRTSLRNNGLLEVLPINHKQENAAYGVGIVTTLAHTYAGLEAMGEPMTPADYDNFFDARAVFEAMALHGQRTITDRAGVSWASTCFGQDPATGEFTAERRDRSCADPIGYLLAMYPVAEFYRDNNLLLGTLNRTKYDYEDAFPHSVFKNNQGEFLTTGSFGFARYEIYYTFTWEWWKNPSSRPGFTFSYTPPVCELPDATIRVPLGAYSLQKGIEVSIGPQPVGTEIYWQVFNVAGGDSNNYRELRGTEREDQSFTTFTFDAACEAKPTTPVGNFIVQVTVTNPSCGIPRGDNITIPLNKSTAQVHPAAGILMGETASIPVHLQGVGPWVLTWENGEHTEPIHAPDEKRPYVYLRRVTPTVDDTEYSVESVFVEDCEGIASGSTRVNIFSAAGVVTVDPVLTAAGVPTIYRATLTNSAGGPIAGAELIFEILNKEVRLPDETRLVTDANGRVQISHVIHDITPGVFNGGIRFTYEGTSEIRGATGTARLTLQCDSPTVKPTGLNVTEAGGPFEIIVGAQPNCPWTAVSESDWITVSIPANRPNIVVVTVAASTGGARTGTVRIGTRVVNVLQQGGCTYRFVPDIAYLPASGGVSGLDVIATDGCAWFVDGDAGLVNLINEANNTFTDRVNGTGTGRVRFRATRNEEANVKRTGPLYIHDAVTGEIRHTANLNQNAPPPETAPVLEKTIEGGNVRDSQNVTMRLLFSGGPATIRWWADGQLIREGTDENLANLTIAPGLPGYPSTTDPVTYRIMISNSKGTIDESATWSNSGTVRCRVPILEDSTLHSNQWPDDHNSPTGGSNVGLSIFAIWGTHDHSAQLKYQWYRGVAGDTSSKVANGTGPDVSVSPGQTAYYWVEVEDPNCGINQSRTAKVTVTLPSPPRRRRAVGHDFNLDNRNDIPWHNVATGQTEIWAMDGVSHTQTLTVGTAAAGQQLQSSGDLNGDDRPDLVWRNPQTGKNDVWLMNRWNFAGTDSLESRADGNWSIGAVADFDDDNFHDVVWHNNATGANEIWFQSGTTHGTWALPTSPAGWSLHGTGHFNFGESPDLFFYNRATGQSSVWLMNDAERTAVASDSATSTKRRTLKVQPQSLPQMSDPNNVPMLVTDLDNNGRADIIWRNTVTGENSVWIMNDTAVTVKETRVLESRPDQNWQIGGGGPVNNGGGSDTRTATALTVTADPAAHGGATAITATLVANGAPVANRTLVFTLNGGEVARLLTGADGTAVAGASVAGIAAGVYPNAAAVRFDGTEQLRPSQGSADLVVDRPLPVVTWSDPAPITYGTPLSAAQLNATASVPGSFEYNPPAGSILDAGHSMLDVVFTPSDGTLAPVTRSVVLLVSPAPVTIFWPAPAPIAYGTPLSSAQLRATADVPGTFTYTPPAGTILGIGAHTLQATFVPSLEGNYTSSSASVNVTVIQGAQTISWAAPAAITYGTPLSAAQLNATVTKSGAAPAGALTYSPATGTVLPAGTHTLSVTAAATAFYSAATKTVQLTVNRATPVLTWSAPATIVYGTPLSATQLNATASVAGSFTYSPAANTVLSAGTHTLSVQFTPADTANYNGAAAGVSLTVIKATPVLSWTAPAGITYGTALSATQLNATANVAGSFTYSPAAGTILNAGTHTLSAQFTPADPANYEPASKTTSIAVAKALQTLSWASPAPIVYGTPLSAAQLNATVSVVGPSPAGALTYNPAAGTVLQAGPVQVLTVSAAATPNYEPATLSVSIDVLKAKPVLTWAQPSPIVYRTALSSAQLNATANVPGTFAYSPSSGTVLEAGMQPLSAHFTPADTRNYEEAAASVTLEVQQATPVITWPQPAGIVYGTALGATQLNATADVPGAFTYTPASGTILDAGDAQTLSVDFVPSDTRNFRNVSASVTIDVAKAPQTLSWAAPAPIVYGTPLTGAQLDAQVSVVGPAAAGALVYSPAAGTVLDAGSRTLTVTALETANYLSATMSVSLQVDRAPLSLVVHAKSKLYGAPVPALTGTLTGVRNNDPITPSYSTTGTMQSNTGTYPITATLVDPNGRLVNYDVTIVPSTLTVLPAPLQIAANPATSQYSDPLAQLGASFTGFVLGETPAVLGGTLSITTTATPLSAPGTYPIAIGGLTSSNYAIVYVPSTYTVTQEDARVTITSPLFVTVPASTPGTITLSATVKDISATPDAAGDADAGDIRNATLTFVDRTTSAVLCTAPIGLVSADDARTGVATCTVTGAFPPSLTVSANVAGYYVRNDDADDAVVTLSAPTADSVTGSGNIVVAGSPAKVNVNLQYDKTGVAKGHFTLTFQRTVEGVVRKYEVSAARVDSLAILRATTGGTAIITGTAVLRDVTTTTPVVLDAAAPLIATASDNGEPSADDTVSIALLRKDGGFWLSVDWNGERTVPQDVQGGNIQIHQAK